MSDSIETAMDAALSDLIGLSHAAVEEVTLMHNLGEAGKLPLCALYTQYNRTLMAQYRDLAKGMQARLSNFSHTCPEQMTPRLRDIQMMFGTLADDLLIRMHRVEGTDIFGEIPGDDDED